MTVRGCAKRARGVKGTGYSMWGGAACVVSTAFPDALKGAPGRGAPFALGGGCEEKRRLFLAQPFVAAVRAFAARPVAGDLGVETDRKSTRLNSSH